MEKIKILIVMGTDREDSKTSEVLRFVEEQVQTVDGINVKVADVRELSFDYNSKDNKFSELTDWADGFIFLTPEYNHGYPGTLKTLIDTEYGNYNNKAASIIGVSNGSFGGARMIESLISVLKAVGLKITKRDAHFFNVDKALEKKDLENPKKEIEGMLEELIWLTRTLRYGRENF